MREKVILNLPVIFYILYVCKIIFSAVNVVIFCKDHCTHLKKFSISGCWYYKQNHKP